MNMQPFFCYQAISNTQAAGSQPHLVPAPLACSRWDKYALVALYLIKGSSMRFKHGGTP